MSSNTTIANLKLALHTPILFGIQLWILIVVAVLLLALFLTILCLCISCRRRRRRKLLPTTTRFINPARPEAFKKKTHVTYSTSSMDRRLLLPSGSVSPELDQVVISNRWSGSVATRGSAATVESVSMDMKRGSVFAVAELEMATNGFAEENVVGCGDGEVVYRGALADNRQVAVKRLPDISCEDEDFAVEVEGIGHVRHKNLVKLLGYSMEGPYRMLVYEYVDNGNLHQWLHKSAGQISPLMWAIRMKIILGTAKGLAYLHDDLKPRIIHCDIKSSKILLDQQWNPKISGFGLAKLFRPEGSLTTSRLTATSGYIAPEYASTGILSEKADVFSFGVLIMEIVSGRKPVDHSQPQKYLVDWLKSMVADQKAAYVVDPKLAETPSTKELKRILLVALRCVDPDVKNRPRMGDIIHMLQPHDLLLHDEQCVRREPSQRSRTQERPDMGE